ncbi:glutathione S-transferase [Tribonema minus]|uniref:Glutathione S-transferase n=1 Tax=Tribonema minus TaxID=303371 RepID=A0A836CD80_9STRA|nr:glutathione S-transferase [Tribonema minus]
MRRALFIICLAQARSTCNAFVQHSKLSMSAAPARSALEEMINGEFKRNDSTYRSRIRAGTEYEPESGRYHLYVSYACPWAHRTLIVRALKGLTDDIGVTVVAPTWQRTKPDDPQDGHSGWVFAEPGAALTPPSGHGSIKVTPLELDTIGPFKTIRDVYESVKDTNGKYTVPILFDKKTRTIVNNESSEIIEMLNAEFTDIGTNPKLDLDPADLKAAQEEANSWVYPGINNGVYRCGFAQSQQAYDVAVKDVFDALDKAEAILSKQRYIAGDRFTLADVRLFVTLARFDEVYEVYFKCNKRRIADYPNILNYVREIYQMPGVAETVNMEHIKAHYYTSHPRLNTFSIVPAGPDAEASFKQPHDRDRF